jgi:uncharacterized membrane protein
MQAPDAPRGLFPLENPLAIATVVVAVVTLGFWLDKKFKWASKVGATLLVILFGALLSNFGFIATDTPALDRISGGGVATSLGITFLLLAVNLRDLKLAGPRMLWAYAIAAFGTAIGAFAGGLIFAARFGDQAWRVGAVLTGTYTGGGLNLAGVNQWAEVEPSLFAAVNASDNIVTAVWMGATLALPVWLARLYPRPIPQLPAGHAHRVALDHPFFTPAGFSALKLAAMATVGLTIVWLSGAIESILKEHWEGARGPLGVLAAIPGILWMTVIALAVGHSRFFEKVEGAMQLGVFSLHLFFVWIGLMCEIRQIVEHGAAIFFFTLTVVVVHGAFTYGVGRLAGIDVGTISIASQAAVGGPTSALAVAIGREWPALVLPGVIVGLLGYAIGNFLGIGVGVALKAMTGAG